MKKKEMLRKGKTFFPVKVRILSGQDQYPSCFIDENIKKGKNWLLKDLDFFFYKVSIWIKAYKHFVNLLTKKKHLKTKKKQKHFNIVLCLQYFVGSKEIVFLSFLVPLGQKNGNALPKYRNMLMHNSDRLRIKLLHTFLSWKCKLFSPSFF